MWKVVSAVVMTIALIVGLLSPDFVKKASPDADSPSVPKQDTSVAATAIRAMQNMTQSAKIHYKKLSIGYNTNVDLIVDGLGVLKALRVDPTSTQLHPHSSLKSLQEFQDTFANFFSQGSAAERLIENAELCASIVAAAQKVPGHEFYIGGNAALMAQRFALAAPSSRVLLAGWLPENLRKMLPKNVEFVPKAQEQPISEAHLIMEYQKNVHFGAYTSPRANRFIAHCDDTNAQMKPLPEFHTSLETFKPELVVLAGLHLLERGQPGFQDQTLKTIASTVASSESMKKSVVHLELASIASTDFMEKICTRVVPFVDSIGLNEQELGHVFFAINPSLSAGATGEARAMKAAEYIQKEFRDPSIATTVKALTAIFNSAAKLRKNAERTISRIHFHSLKYHIIAQKVNSTFDAPMQALAAGSLIATSEACKFLDYDLPYANEDLPYGLKFDANSPISKLSDKASGIVYYIAPVGVCRKPGKTVGLGDAISALGLLYHATK